MSRGPRMSKTVIHLITQESINHPKKDRRLLATEIQDKISRICEPVPTEETIMKMISKTRNQPRDTLDISWTLAESVNRDFPSEATPALLRAWKHCLALEIPFTIRMAKWASYLSTVIPDTATLVLYAHHYSTRERVYQLIGEEFDSTGLDAALTMDFSEYLTMSLLAKIYPLRVAGGVLPLKPKTVVSFIEDAYEAARIAEYTAIAIIRFKHEDKDNTDKNALRASHEDWDVLPSIKESDLTEELVWIYTYWLTWLAKGPRWKDLQKEQIIHTMKQLREWVRTLKDKNLNRFLNFANLIKVKDIDYDDVLSNEDLVPIELTQKAGYSYTGSINTLPGSWPILIDHMNYLESKGRKYLNKKHKIKPRNNSEEK